MVDAGTDMVPPPVHMPTMRWLSASIAWIRASSDPVRGWIFFHVLLRQNTYINMTSFTCQYCADWQEYTGRTATA